MRRLLFFLDQRFHRQFGLIRPDLTRRVQRRLGEGLDVDIGFGEVHVPEHRPSDEHVADGQLKEVKEGFGE